MAEIAVVAVMALAALNKGAQERKAAYAKAEAVRDVRNRGMAATTAQISERERQKEQMESRALAVSAASGAGVDDPGIVNLVGDLNAEGEYRILAGLYVGSSEAAGLETEVVANMKAGEAALDAAYVEAAKTVISSFMGGGGGGEGMFSGMFGGGGGGATASRPAGFEVSRWGY